MDAHTLAPSGDFESPAHQNPVLAQHADAIRALRSRIVSDVAEIGRRLLDVKRIVGHGNWLPWLDREFGWSEDTAERFIRVHEFVEGLSDSASVRNLVLNLPVSSVYLLAAPSTPEAAKTEILKRAEAGEQVTAAETKRVVAAAKGKPAAKKPRCEASAASTAPTFEIAAELQNLVATKAPGWTGAIAGTQGEVDAAEKRFCDDGAPGHWLVAAPRERLVIDFRTVQWLLLTTPPPPVAVRIEWIFDLCGAANKARCPVWVSERLTGKSHSQRPGMTCPRELPIPREMSRDDVGPDSQGELERLRARVGELQAQVHQRDIRISGLESEVEKLRGELAATAAGGGEVSTSEFQTAKEWEDTAKKWQDTVEVQRGIIARLQNEIANLRAGTAAPPAAADGLDIPECLRRAAP
jgi:hypothetical protein